MVRYVVLRYAMLRYGTLRYVTLCYVMLRYVTVHYGMLCYVVFCYVALRNPEFSAKSGLLGKIRIFRQNPDVYMFFTRCDKDSPPRDAPHPTS